MADAAARWLPWMERAARIAGRGHGLVEPNPMVGCVIVAPDGTEIAEGYHRRLGGPHAEVEALRRAGARARGATAVVTLEPCNHHGRTGPCSAALREAGVARVVYACADPHPQAAGGAAALAAAGIEVLHLPCAAAERVTAPFLHRVRTGLPWVTVKWAQTLDGRIATRTGASQWISGERSRAMVHRERGRVDAILTGIGTVIADDPLLTARTPNPRRIPRRVVWDPRLELPESGRLATTAREAPCIAACTPETLEARGERAAKLRALGVDVRAAQEPGALLRELAGEGVSTVLVEAGGGLVGALLRARLVNELSVFVAPRLLGDDQARGPMRGGAPEQIADGLDLELVDARRRGDDMLLRYRVPPA
ncbi:MAG: bifunctional diaminohydroxyphosphoribosylaminopyrimidine deaminase/5-amino-6-(5-phosphoribosylamino)uracil reductase RibD [Phycisphaerales bacterium]